MRCTRCGGNNRQDQQTCWRCSLVLPRASSVRNTVMESFDTDSCVPVTPATISQSPAEVAPLPTRSSLWQMFFSLQQELAGTVIAVEPVHEERRQRNWRRFAFLGMLVIIALTLPFILLTISVLLAIVLIVLGIALLKFISPGKILQGLLLFRFLWQGHQDNRVPVQYFRLRDGAQREEYIVRIRGRLQGHIMPGDEVSLRGAFRDGIFEMKSGTNLRTRSFLGARSER